MRITSTQYLDTLYCAMECLRGPSVEMAVNQVRAAIKSNTPIYICGNGGSAAMANHAVIDLMKMCGATRVYSLVGNSSITTAIANDISFADVFAWQIPDKEPCLLIAISSSGASLNVIRAANKVRVNEGTVIGISGKKEYNHLLTVSTVGIAIPSDDTQILEDITGIALHLIARLVREANNA